MTTNSISDQLKAFRFHIDRNIISYGICVLIASILWFLNALNKDYTSEIAYPVKYTDFPAGKYLVSDLPQNITLEVKAKGFALLTHQIRTSFLPIIVNVNSYSNHSLEKGDIFEYTLQLNEIKDKISNQLNSDIKLLSIHPDKIDFRFSPSVTKKVAVYPVVRYSLKQQYILKGGILCIPDSVMASGPAQIMDTLQYVYTEPWEAGEIRKNLVQTVGLTPIQGVKFEDIKIKIEMQPERYTEASRTIPVKVLNLPDSLDIKLFPGSVDITYEIGLSKYDAVKDSDFTFTVDYLQVTSGSFLPVHLLHSPTYIKDLRYSPQKVEFILEQK